ncbi:UDP-glucose/GDP-mannose dehydrogenase family protein [Vibrio sp. 404]|uniref:UDP-glucose 6-dehydrogenase n=1 Tax=Vibrio marinisediminis TaxID=2758441 RepID=A0A7W2FUA4_9VIBR|nr:UDP-glucose/GDP-mannose dehydrogenase family protein [Vibrio marinisediminis]MBA5764373.1 UDP-glucose/GDP-mannose dehydrogenase family protein [Vibrio marinisediminis]
MKISIFGMGYVGAVCSACMAKRGNNIIGVDVSQEKVAMIASGKSPIVEAGLNELLAEGVRNNFITATSDYREAVLDSDVSMVCVPTPSLKNGNLNTDFIKEVCKEIGSVIKNKDTRHTVIIRSTVLPGTVADVVIPTLEKYSGKTAGDDFGVGVNPEFLRESTAIYDYDNPPMTVVGALDDTTAQILEQLYSDLDAPFICEDIAVAEMIKYSCNVWHALKVSFANEIGSIAKAVNVDGRRVMKVVCEDKKLNLSSYYMKPGFAFGGSCLPKDVRALSYRAKQMDLETPVISSIMQSNEEHITRAFNMVEESKVRKVAMLGLSFKAGTDDLRESPFVILAEKLLGKGYDLSILDRNVKYASVHGSNKEYINNHIPHISSLLEDTPVPAILNAELVLICNGDESYKSILGDLPHSTKVIDLHGLIADTSDTEQQGICW